MRSSPRCPRSAPQRPESGETGPEPIRRGQLQGPGRPGIAQGNVAGDKLAQISILGRLLEAVNDIKQHAGAWVPCLGITGATEQKMDAKWPLTWSTGPSAGPCKGIPRPSLKNKRQKSTIPLIIYRSSSALQSDREALPLKSWCEAPCWRWRSAGPLQASRRSTKEKNEARHKHRHKQTHGHRLRHRHKSRYTHSY